MVYTFGGITPETQGKIRYETPNQNNVTTKDFLIYICGKDIKELPITEIRPLGCTGKNEKMNADHPYVNAVIKKENGSWLIGERVPQKDRKTIERKFKINFEE